MEKIIQITAGKGPAECCWVVAQVLKRFIDELKELNIEYTIIQREQASENRTLHSATVQLKGRDLEMTLKPWLGTIQWIGISSFRKFHKRKNWFVGIYEIEASQVMNMNERDIKYQAMRSSGPGGQHVNKVSSVIRAMHEPTGIQVVVMETRSQHQNKKIALNRLKDRVKKENLNNLKDSIKNNWVKHLNLERGNPIRVFKGSDFKSNKAAISKGNKPFSGKRYELKKDLKQQLWD